MSRRIAVRIDDATVAPRVGDIAAYRLLFEEVAGDPSTPAIVARAEVPGAGSRQRHQGDWIWVTGLHGDGWSATWSAPRPVIGGIEVRGRFLGTPEPCRSRPAHAVGCWT